MKYRYSVESGVSVSDSGTKKYIIGLIAAVLMLAVTTIPTFAAPGSNGQGNGGCVDNFYGNATNPRPSGNGVLPSQSPGPFVNTGYNEPPRNDRTAGSSVGDIMKLARGYGLNGNETMDLICQFP